MEGHVVANVPGLGQAASLSSSDNTVLSDPLAARHDSISASGQCAVLVAHHEEKIVVAGGETFKRQVLPLTVLRSFRPADSVASWEIKELKKKNGPAATQNNGNSKKRRAGGNGAKPVAYPVPRRYQTLTADRNAANLYLVGGLKAEGRDTGHPCKSMFALDSSTMVWNAVPIEQPTETKKDREKLIGPRFAHTANFYTGSPASKSQRARARKTKAGCILVYGGYDSATHVPSGNGNMNVTMDKEKKLAHLPKNTIHTFDIRSEKWNLVAAQNDGPRRAYHASVILNDRYLVVHGGCTGAYESWEELSDALYLFDTIKATWFKPPIHLESHSVPTPRRSHSAANGIGPHKGLGVFFGGAVEGGEFSGSFHTLALVENDSSIDDEVCAVWREIPLFQHPFAHGTFKLAAAALVACETKDKYFVIGGKGKHGTQAEPFTIDATATDMKDIAMPESIPLRLRVRETEMETQVQNETERKARENQNQKTTTIKKKTFSSNANGADSEQSSIANVLRKTKHTNGVSAKMNGDPPKKTATNNTNNRTNPEASIPAVGDGVEKSAGNGTRGKRKLATGESNGVLGKRKAAAVVASNKAKRAKANGRGITKPYDSENMVQTRGVNGSATEKASNLRESQPRSPQANEARIGTSPMKVILKLFLRKPGIPAGDTVVAASVPMSSIGDIQFSAPLGDNETIASSSSLRKNAAYRSYVKPIAKGRRVHGKEATGRNSSPLAALKASGDALFDGNNGHDGTANVNDNDVEMNEMETANKLDDVAPVEVQANGISADKEDVNMRTDEMEKKKTEDVKMKEEETARAAPKTAVALPVATVIRETMDISDDEENNGKAKEKNQKSPRAAVEDAVQPAIAKKKKNEVSSDIKINGVGISDKKEKRLRPKAKKKKHVPPHERPETAVSAHMPDEAESESVASRDATTDDEGATGAAEVPAESEVERLRKEVRRLTKDNKHLNSQVKALSKTRTQEAPDMEDFKEEMAELEQANGMLKRKNEGLAKDLADTREALRIESNHVNDLERVATQRDATLETQRNAIRKMDGLFIAFEDERIQKDTTIVRLTEQVNALTKRILGPANVSRNASAEDENVNVIHNNANAAALQQAVVQQTNGLPNGSGAAKDEVDGDNGNGNDDDGDVEMKEEEAVVTKEKRKKERK